MWNHIATNKYFQVLEERKILVNHWKALKEVKSRLKIKSIKKPKFLENNKKKEVMLNNKRNKIEKENRILYNKVLKIEKEKGRLNPSNLKKLTKFKIQPKNKIFKNFYDDICLRNSNEKLKYRLYTARSNYSLKRFNKKNNWDKEYKNNLDQNFKNNYNFSKLFVKTYR